MRGAGAPFDFAQRKLFDSALPADWELTAPHTCNPCCGTKAKMSDGGTVLAGGCIGLSSQFKPDLAPRTLGRNHQLTDGFDELLDPGIMAFQAVLQFIELGSELPVCGQHLP